MSYNPTYYTGIFLPIVVLQIKDSNVLQYTGLTSTTFSSKKSELCNDLSITYDLASSCRCSSFYQSGDSLHIGINPYGQTLLTNFDGDFLSNNITEIINAILNKNKNNTISVYINLNQTIINIDYTDNQQNDGDFSIDLCTNVSASYYTGKFDQNALTINKILYGVCIIPNTIRNDNYYNFTTLSFNSNYIGTNINFGYIIKDLQNNYTNTYNVSPPNVIVDDGIQTVHFTTPYNMLMSSNNQEVLHNGSVWTRYYYHTMTTDLSATTFFTTTTITELVSSLVSLSFNSTIGQTSLLFTDFSGCSSYLTKTVLYIFLAYFYGQLYHYQEFSNLLLNDFYIKSNQRYNIMNGIPQFIQDKITTYYNQIISGSTRFTLPPTTLFTSWFIPPTVTVIDASTNNVYLRCYLPVRMVPDFFTQSVENQNALLSSYLVNFFNEQHDQYYSGNNVNAKTSVLPSLYTLQPTLSSPTDYSSNLIDIIQSIGNNKSTIGSSSVYSSHVMWVDVHTNTTYFYQGGTIVDMSGHDVSGTIPVSLFSSAYTTMDSSSSTVDPFVLSIGVTVFVTKWSPKLTAYCLQQMKTSRSIRTIPPTIVTTRDPFYTIYLNMTRSGWIPSPLYPIIMSQLTNQNTIRSVLLDFCNTYLTPMRNSELNSYETYSYLYPWLVSKYSTGADTSNNDCACVFSLLSPAGVPDPNVVSMCYDTNCQSMSPTILAAFGVTKSQCSKTSTCNTINEWMTTSNVVNRASVKNSFNGEAYSSSCGTSLYTTKTPNAIHKNVIGYGSAVVVLIGITIILLCVALRIPSVYTAILSTCIILSLAIGMYYLSKYVVGKWTCGPPGSTAVCKSNQNPSLLLPDEFCTDTKPSCECVSDSNCSFLGVVPPVTTDASGNCLYKSDASGNCYTPYVDISGRCIHGSDSFGNCFIGSCVAGSCVIGSGKPRPVKTVTASKMISYMLFYFLVLLACLLPTICVLCSSIWNTRLSTYIIGLFCIILFVVPLLYLYKNYSTTITKTVYKDNPLTGGSNSYTQTVTSTTMSTTGTTIPTTNQGLITGSNFPNNTTVRITNISSNTFDSITCYDDIGHTWVPMKISIRCSDPTIQPDANGKCNCPIQTIPCINQGGIDSTYGTVCMDKTNTEYKFTPSTNLLTDPCYCPTYSTTNNGEINTLPCTCLVNQSVDSTNPTPSCTITTVNNSTPSLYVPQQSIYITLGAISSLTCIATKNGINYITVMGNVNGKVVLFTPTGTTTLSFSLGLGSEMNITPSFQSVAAPITQPLQNAPFPISVSLRYPSSYQSQQPSFLIQQFLNTNGVSLSYIIPSTITVVPTTISLETIVNNGYVVLLQQYSATPLGLYGLILYNNQRTINVITLGQPFLYVQ